MFPLTIQFATNSSQAQFLFFIILIFIALFLVAYSQADQQASEWDAIAQEYGFEYSHKENIPFLKWQNNQDFKRFNSNSQSDIMF